MSKNKQYFTSIAQEIYVPSNQSLKMGNIYLWGFNNYYPYQLLEAYYCSPTHQSLVKSKVNGIIGQGVKVENQENLDEYMKYGNKDLNTIIENVAFDLVMYGGFSIKVAKSVDGQYAHLDNLDFSGIRMSTDIDEDGNVQKVIYSRDWRNTALKENRKKEYPIYNKNVNDVLSAFIYMKDTRAGERYPRPSYEAAMASILAENQIQLFHLRNLLNNYSPTMIIKLKASMPDEDYALFKRQLEEKYKGADNAGGVIIVAGENAETAPDIEYVNPIMQDNVYIEQMNQIKQSILTAHQVTNPSIGGLPSQGAFSSGQEIQIAYDLFDRTVINNLRMTIQNSLNTIFDNSGWNLGKIEIIPTNYDLTQTNNDNQQTQEVVNQ
jgi:hypothetical protein